MSNFAPYANHGYLALIKESTAGTAVIPTTFVGLLSESIVPSFAIKSIQTIAGDRERNIRSVPDKIEIAGDVEFFVESKAIGHFLRSYSALQQLKRSPRLQHFVICLRFQILQRRIHLISSQLMPLGYTDTMA